MRFSALEWRMVVVLLASIRKARSHVRPANHQVQPALCSRYLGTFSFRMLTRFLLEHLIACVWYGIAPRSPLQQSFRALRCLLAERHPTRTWNTPLPQSTLKAEREIVKKAQLTLAPESLPRQWTSRKAGYGSRVYWSDHCFSTTLPA